MTTPADRSKTAKMAAIVRRDAMRQHLPEEGIRAIVALSRALLETGVGAAHTFKHCAEITRVCMKTD